MYLQLYYRNMFRYVRIKKSLFVHICMRTLVCVCDVLPEHVSPVRAEKLSTFRIHVDYLLIKSYLIIVPKKHQSIYVSILHISCNHCNSQKKCVDCAGSTAVNNVLKVH